MYAYACFLIALGLIASVSAQTIHLTGRIPCEGRLDLVNSGPSLRGESSGRSVRARIIGSSEDRVRVVLSLRTNCGYRVTAANTPVEITEPTVLPAKWDRTSNARRAESNSSTGGTCGGRADCLRFGSRSFESGKQCHSR